ncbi:hypothetical protein PO124_32590 [Bacillus licheniformis]|nr:hypothetical protein [Bacillus licheniformis]
MYGRSGVYRCEKYDIEVWIPSQTHIVKFHHAATLKLSRPDGRISDSEGKQRQARACPYAKRIRLGSRQNGCRIIGNYQQEDGSVIIPKALRPYMGNRDVIQP